MSSRPGSKIGTSPRRRASTFSGTTSRTYTSWPSSAKQAAVTRPTHPAPITPIGSRSATDWDGPLAGVHARSTLQGLGGAGDRHQVAPGDRLEQRVRDPVDGVVLAPRDHPQPLAVEVEVVLAAADPLRHVGRAQDRRVHPLGALEAVVLADLVAGEHDPVAPPAAPVRPADPVRARRVDAEARSLHGHARVVDAHPAHATGHVQRLLLAERRDVHQVAGGALLELRRAPALAARLVDAQELLRDLVHRELARRDVAGADLRREVDLAHGRAGGADGELEQGQHLLAALDVGARVLRDDLDELVLVAEQPSRAHLRLRLAQEVL